jgi:hypothetical protein
MWIIPTDNKSLLGVLNSKMGWWLITKYCTQIQNGCQLIWKYFGKIPIPELISPELEKKVNSIIFNTNLLNSNLDNFQNYLKSQFKLEKLSKKLQNWYTLEFSDFIKEINKAIKSNKKEKLTKLQEMDWMEVFEVKKAEAQTIKTQIDQTDKEIDAMVYELYGLTEDEILIVENS